MLKNPIYVEPAQVAALIRATFPNYTGRKVEIRPSATVGLHDLNWSGGSRSQYRACTLDGQPAGSADKFNHVAPWENVAEGKTLDIALGHCVVEHCIFMGKDHGLRIYARPEDMAPLLPAPVALSPAERIVLNATATYKSSYQGRDRYDMARADARGYGVYNKEAFATFPTREGWNAAKESLIGRGLLNKAGAITNAGRNAIAGEVR